MRVVFRLPVYLYRWHGGWLLGHRFLLLIHRGRRTGRRHETVLEVMRYRGPAREAVVMSGFGHAANWLRNIEAQPALEVVVGRKRFVPVHRILGEDEAAEVLGDYERRNRLVAPIVRRVLSRLVGWTYDGTDEARHRLVRDIPVIAFRPADQ